MTTENYVYKKEEDGSLLQEGLTLPFNSQRDVAFDPGILPRSGLYNVTKQRP